MYLLALVAGLLLCASDHPLHWWPLQFVALAPFWFALARRHAQQRRLWPLGLAFGCGYALPLVLSIGADLPILVAGIFNVVQWTLVAPLAGRLLARGPVLGAFGAAAVLTLVEVAIWYAVPMFGTAQCFVRPLSAAPALVAFVAYTGVAGLVFTSAALQALAVAALRGPSRGRVLLAATLLAAVVATLSGTRTARTFGPRIRVAVHGWGGTHPGNNRSLLEVYEQWFTNAATTGAALLVTPETGMWVSKDGRDALLGRFGAMAKKHGVAAALGVWHDPTRDNRIWFFDAQGELRGEYRKSHLVPWLEDYTAGDGTLVPLDLAGTQLGGMICQDDNFTDLARGYGRLGVRLMAVPTNDWPAIREFHLENSIFRALENGYAIARAASGGISALVSADGSVMRLDHVATDTPGELVMDVATGDGEVTVYARFGDWPMVVLSALLLLFGLRRERR